MKKRATGDKAAKKKKTKSEKGVSEAARALWRVGGPLNGYKDIPWAISKVEKDGKTFKVKAYIRDDDRLEENMVLQMIAVLGWPRSPQNDWKVDAYYPDVALFAELHETQHVDRADFRMLQPGRWEAQKASDKNKAIYLVRQGHYGVIVLGFDGPIPDANRTAPRWNKVSPAEVQRRTMHALRSVAEARLENYAKGDYAARVYVFSSAYTRNAQEMACQASTPGHQAEDGCTDASNIGERYLDLAEVRAAAQLAAGGFTAAQKAELLAKAQDMYGRVKSYLQKPPPIPSTSKSSEEDEDDESSDSGEEKKTIPSGTPVIGCARSGCGKRAEYLCEHIGSALMPYCSEICSHAACPHQP